MTAVTLARPLRRRPAADLPAGVRTFLATGAILLTLLIAAALLRALTGGAPARAALKEVALAIHLVTVIPALPLGAWVLVNRKGGARHRLLGKIWLSLMIAAAMSAYWIRHLNGGSLSFIHLLIPVVLVGSWRVIATARRGDIVAHRRVLLGLFIGGMLVPAALSFLPGRLMAVWLLG